jgi:hypothetical protein
MATAILNLLKNQQAKTVFAGAFAAIFNFHSLLPFKDLENKKSAGLHSSRYRWEQPWQWNPTLSSVTFATPPILVRYSVGPSIAGSSLRVSLTRSKGLDSPSTISPTSCSVWMPSDSSGA